MDKKRQQILTQKGYDFFEISSAFQKSVRRGKIDESCYWATELLNSNYHKYLWKRILIITVEDIGIAEPDAIVRIKALHDTFFSLIGHYKVETKEPRIMVYQAIYYLCKAPKTRLADYMKNYYHQSHNERNLEIPDYALDIHTRKGKMKGRGLSFFYEEGSKVEPHQPVHNELELKEWLRHEWCDLNETERNEKKKFSKVGDYQTDMFNQ